MGRLSEWEQGYGKYAAATWNGARWGVLLTASATHQLMRQASQGPGSAVAHTREALHWAGRRAHAAVRRAQRGAWPRPRALSRELGRAHTALAQRGISMVTLSASAGLCIALGAFAPLELVRWLAACALCAAIVVREHARESEAEGLRARVAALEARVVAAQRSAHVELVDVALLDEQALLTARTRSRVLAREADDELDARRAFAFGSAHEERA